MTLTGETSLPEKDSTQRVYDAPLNKRIFDSLLNDGSQNEVSTARLLAASKKESGQWLNAYPIPNLGLKLSDRQLQIAISLRLGTEICEEFKCKCNQPVNKFATHALSCKKNSGRFSRHSSVNDIIKRALSSAGFPSILEPTGISRTDGKRPDGLTLIAWKEGKSLLWDFTCTDTLAPSNLKLSSMSAGKSAEQAELRKYRHYDDICKQQYIFIPICVETLGSFGPSGAQFFKLLGSKLVVATGEPKAANYFRQSLSMAVQRGNANSIISSFPKQQPLKEIDFL
jgi:hypothetical protein